MLLRAQRLATGLVKRMGFSPADAVGLSRAMDTAGATTKSCGVQALLARPLCTGGAALAVAVDYLFQGHGVTSDPFVRLPQQGLVG